LRDLPPHVFVFLQEERIDMDIETVISGVRLMDVQEAAEMLRIAPKTVYGLVSQRRIPFRKAGRRLLFLQSELLEWTQPRPDRRDKYADFQRR
jgi:excisionase family DNA binding protein